MKVIIDRFEGSYAVCEKEDGNMINIERNKILEEAEQGDVLLIKKDEIIIDHEETKSRKKEIEALTKNLWK